MQIWMYVLSTWAMFRARIRIEIKHPPTHNLTKRQFYQCSATTYSAAKHRHWPVNFNKKCTTSYIWYFNSVLNLKREWAIFIRSCNGLHKFFTWKYYQDLVCRPFKCSYFRILIIRWWKKWRTGQQDWRMTDKLFRKTVWEGTTFSRHFCTWQGFPSAL